MKVLPRILGQASPLDLLPNKHTIRDALAEYKNKYTYADNYSPPFLFLLAPPRSVPAAEIGASPVERGHFYF